MNEASKIVVITGASRGIGLQVAKRFLKEGATVYNLARGEAPLPKIRSIPVDVRDEAGLRQAVQLILEKEGRIDVAIANAGYGISGSIEATNDLDSTAQMDINFHGCDRFCRAVAKAIRESQGRILAVASVAAVIPIPFQSYYSASKAAIVAYIAALDAELRPSGARALVVLPGDTKTGFTDHRKKASETDPFYLARVASSVSRMEDDERQGDAADKIAKRLVRMTRTRRPKTVYVVGLKYQAACFLYRFLPQRLAHYLIFKRYGI